MHADWIYGPGGGLIIGLAAAICLLVNGRIMGASGILGGLVDRSGHDTATERLSFLAGLIGVPALATLGSGGRGGLLFLSAMLAGMIGTPGLRRRIDRLAPG